MYLASRAVRRIVPALFLFSIYPALAEPTDVAPASTTAGTTTGTAAATAAAAPAISPNPPASPQATPPVIFKPTALGLYVDAMAFTGWIGSTLTLWQSTASPQQKLPEADGLKAAILREYGLQSYTRKSFQRGQRFIYIDAYQFESGDGAFAAYNYLRHGATTVVLRGDATSEDDDSISFVQGKTFVSIYGTSADDDESKDVIRSVATQIAKGITEHGSPPYILSIMPQLEFLRGSEKFVMGPVSARRFCPAPFLTALDFKQAKLACVADYQMREPVKERVKLLYIDYAGNKKAADASYRSYIEALCASRDENPDLRLQQPSNQFRNGSTFIEIQLSGARVLMVTGARKKYSADLLLRQVR